ncbi:putative secreted protein (Por secretion system target) [Flavobacterium tiangeerense]|uniref:Secreted protein (Por secretion system target) n=2 Tax=Flavobacterium tiangeerense TaxID=459471 RepID=A0ABY3FL26_9FLAO|nr:putative secreted protein (Por secretion system target) [Flavobacterium tiangeerense]
MFLFLTITLQAQTNLVPNGNFENWTSSSQPNNWFRFFNGLVFQSTSAQNGSSSTKMQITSGTFNYINSEFFPVVAGKTYRITMYHKLVTGTFSAIDLSLYHQPGTFKTEITKKTDAITSSTEWRKIEFDYTPTISESIEVDIWTTGTLNSEILVDNVSVVDVATIGAAYTFIPDLNFEKKLIELGHDSGTPDGKVLTSSIAAVTSLNVDTQLIADLTGIQDFTSLKALICVPTNGNFSINGGGGLLTKLDVTKNKALTSLSCYANKIKDLDISQNVVLTSLEVYGNGMIALNVSSNVALTSLDCSFNKISSIDVSKNVALINLNFFYNALTTIDLSKNLALQYLSCSNNQLTTVDVSKNVALQYLSCFSNQLTTIDVSKNVALTTLICYSNKLTTLDLSKNVALKFLDCSSNQLTNFNLKNGKNTLITTTNLNLTKNPNLNCIMVDDVAYANTNWAGRKDIYAFFSPYDCSLTTQIPDAKFEDKLIALSIDTDGKNGVVLSSSIATITTLDVANSSILDLKGIEGFKALTTLNCSGNQLKKLDLSKNTAIATLNCSNNPSLTCIQVADIAVAEKWNTTKDVAASFSLDCTIYTLIPDAKFEDKLIALGIDKDGKNGKVATQSITSLTSLNIANSNITDLTGIQDFAELQFLYCERNQIANINVSNNLKLIYLHCFSNKLTSLDVTRNILLENLDCSANLMSSLDVTKNTALRFLAISKFSINSRETGEGNFESIDVSKNLLLQKLYCQQNKIQTLDLSKNTKLEYLECSENSLKELNLSNNTLLNFLQVNNNQLTTIDVSKNILLNYLICRQNKLTRLDVSKNLLLTSISCSANQIKNLDVSKNTKLEQLYSERNQLKSLNLKNGNNALLRYSDLRNNPELSCIEVDNVDFSNTNWITFKDSNTSFSTNCTSYTIIPDPKFEDELIALGFDTDGKNGKVLTANIATVTSLDVSNAGITDLTGIEDFTSLQSLSCNNNQLTKIDLKYNHDLESLNIANNKISVLKLVYNTKLGDIQCNDNLIRTLDFSLLKNLSQIMCQNNKLVSLNLKNGTNKLTNGPSIKNFTSNPELTCIQVDDATYSNTNWTFYKDTTANYSSDCAYSTLIPDSKFEDKLIALGIDTDGKNGKVLTASIENVTALNVSTSSITDLTGIQDFVSLVFLNCSINQITALDTSKNLALTTLDCSNNKITSLDVSKNIALTKFNCFNNNLQSLNLKNGKNSLLIKDNIALSNNRNLYCILVDDVAYANTNWSTRKDATTAFNSVECIALSLPSNNFAIESKGETCLNTNNGEINITATAAYGYKATINATPYTFTNNSLKVTNLAPGSYTVTITIPGENFEQIFTINIPKGATITGRLSKVTEKIAVEIATGTAPYTVFLNGVEQFETNDTSFTVDAKTSGLLEVKSAKACEGIFAKEIATLEGTFSAFPNPTSGAFEIEIPTTNKEVSISIFNLEGKLISNKKYSVGNGKVQLSLDDQPAGIYMTKVELDRPEFIKIIKK